MRFNIPRRIGQIWVRARRQTNKSSRGSRWDWYRSRRYQQVFDRFGRQIRREPIVQAAVVSVAKAIAYSSGEIDVNSELGQELLSEFTRTSRSK